MYTQHGWAANGLTTTGRQTFLLFFSEAHAEALNFTAGDFRRSEGRESRRFRICQATRTNCKSHDNSCRPSALIWPECSVLSSVLLNDIFKGKI